MKKKWFILIGLVVLITIVIFFLVRREKNVNVYEFPETLIVVNHTNQKNVETYSKIILSEIYGYDTLKLDIVNRSRDFSTNDIEVVGWIQQNPYEPHTYMIFIKKGMSSSSVKNFLSHELIHAHQMELGDLVQLPNQPVVIYKGDTIDFHEVSYRERPFEIEAIHNQNNILKKLNYLLYSKK